MQQKLQNALLVPTLEHGNEKQLTPILRINPNASAAHPEE